MNACVKTGCDVAFAHSPEMKYRCDMFVFHDNAIFQFNQHVRYAPDTVPDIIIKGNDYLEMTSTIITELKNVHVISGRLVTQFSQYCPDILEKVQHG